MHHLFSEESARIVEAYGDQVSYQNGTVTIKFKSLDDKTGEELSAYLALKEEGKSLW